jgi:two-component system, chemotaxis family, chemotaxis protein CheY
MARILVIDDDEQIREMVRRILESRGHTVEDADQGVAGIAYVAQRAPDLVITDIFMPGQDGIEVLLELRKAFPKLKVIAMSGGNGPGLLNLLEDAELLGADRTLPKPFTPRELIAAVNDTLGEGSQPSP